MLAVDEDDELIGMRGKQPSDAAKGDTQYAIAAEQQLGYAYGADDFPAMILENLKTSGVQQAHKEDRISFTSIAGWPGRFI